METVASVLAALDSIAPPHLCLGSDPRGLLLGDAQAAVESLIVALDITPSVAEFAASLPRAMVVAHHPLLFHPTKTLRADRPFPEPVLLACARAGVAVACAHTSWDVAPGGINDVLASLLGLQDTRPLRITWRSPLQKLVVFVPESHREVLLEALAGAGAGAIGNYERCAFWVEGTGTFTPRPGAQPYVGSVGQAESVREARLEMIVASDRAEAVLAAMHAAHPYEEVAHFLSPLANTTGEAGIGRIGTLKTSESAAAFAARVEKALGLAPRTLHRPERPIQTVAVCGGAGAELLPDAISAGADAFVTGDVRHHEFVDALARDFLLLDAGHHATENPGTQELARRLEETLPALRVTFLELAGTTGAPASYP